MTMTRVDKSLKFYPFLRVLIFTTEKYMDRVCEVFSYIGRAKKITKN